MAIPLYKTVTTFKGLVSSIETDRQVYRWFAFLTGQAAVRARLSDGEGMGQLYRDLKRATHKQRILSALLLFLLFVTILSKQYLLFGAGLIALPVWIDAHLKKKKCVVNISSYMLSQDFEKLALSQKTLYQTCELYSQKYKILSLVDAIYFSDKASRGAIIVTFVVTGLIYPLGPGHMYLAMITAFYLVRAVVNTSLIYRYIK